MAAPLRLTGTLSPIGSLSGSLSGIGGMSGVLSSATVRVPVYAGPYEFTPTQSTQTIEIADKRALEDIIIAPIPSNYGLITWDGVVITVS